MRVVSQLIRRRCKLSLFVINVTSPFGFNSVKVLFDHGYSLQLRKGLVDILHAEVGVSSPRSASCNPNSNYGSKSIKKA